MKIDPRSFSSILQDTIEENPLACRAVLSICRVEFTKDVPTLCVTLGTPSVLRVNLDFLGRHCAGEKHVKAVLIHEFLHVLLGHTLKFGKMTERRNLALDAVINSIIHRVMGGEYSSMMGSYYAEESGLLRLLRPPTPSEAALARSRPATAPPSSGELAFLHRDLYAGTTLSDDVFDFAEKLVPPPPRNPGLPPVFLGNHSGNPDTMGDLSPADARRVFQGLAAMDASEVFRAADSLKPMVLRPRMEPAGVPRGWKPAVARLLRELICPDSRGAPTEPSVSISYLPVPSPSDRRGFVRALFSPFVPEFRWHTPRESERGSTQVYLDVSASMDRYLPPISEILSHFSPQIRQPLWGFSTEVSPAKLSRGRLLFTTTGGTSIRCLFEHAARTSASKVLIVTDGFVEDSGGLKKPSGCEFSAIIPHDGGESALRGWGIPVSKLPPL